MFFMHFNTPLMEIRSCTFCTLIFVQMCLLLWSPLIKFPRPLQSVPLNVHPGKVKTPLQLEHSKGLIWTSFDSTPNVVHNYFVDCTVFILLFLSSNGHVYLKFKSGFRRIICSLDIYIALGYVQYAQKNMSLWTWAHSACTK